MQFTQALLSQLLQHLTNHFTTNPKALLISNAHWEKDKYWFTSHSAAAMARLTAAALMNWGRAPTTVRSCVIVRKPERKLEPQQRGCAPDPHRSNKDASAG